MSGWKGWQDDTLKAWKAPTVKENVLVLNVWSQSVTGGAKNNPLAGTYKVAGSKNYKSGPVQDYPTPKAALTAYRDEIKQSQYADVLAGFRNGNPEERAATGHTFTDELAKWGVNVSKFDAILTAISQGPPKATPGVHPPKGVSSAWRNMLRFYSRDVPKAHGQATKLAASYRHIFK